MAQVSALPSELVACILDKLMEPVSEEEYKETAAYKTRCARDVYSLLLVSKTWSIWVISLLYKDIILPLEASQQRGRVLFGLQHNGGLVKSLAVEGVHSSNSWDNNGHSTLEFTFQALELCGRLRALTLTLSFYPQKDDFDELCQTIQGLPELEDLELRCNGQPSKYMFVMGLPDEPWPWPTWSTIYQLVLFLPRLKSFTCKPVSYRSKGFPAHTPSPSRLQSYSHSHALQHISVQGEIYTGSLVSFLHPFRALESLTVDFSYRSRVAVEDLASLLFFLRATLRRLTITGWVEGLYRRADESDAFFSEPNSQPDSGSVPDIDGIYPTITSNFPEWHNAPLAVQDCISSLERLQELVLMLDSPGHRYPGRPTVRICDSTLFARLPGTLQLLRANIPEMSPSAVVAFLKRAEGVGIRRNFQLELLVGYMAWRGDETGEIEVKRLVEGREGGSYHIEMVGYPWDNVRSARVNISL